VFSGGVGLSITRDAVQVAGLGAGKGKPEVLFLDHTPIPAGTFADDGSIQNPALLRDVVQRLREDHHVERVHISLPEEHAYVFSVTLPSEAMSDIAQAIEFHLKENVPFSLDQILFDYEVLQVTEREMVAQVVVYPIAVASEYFGVCLEAGYVLAGAELHGKSIARACLGGADEMAAILLLDGGVAAVIAVRDGIVYTSVELGVESDELVRALMKTLQVSQIEALRILHLRGVTLETDKEAACIRGVVDTYLQALTEKIAYWNVRALGAEGAIEQPHSLQIAGRHAAVRGLAEYIAAHIEMPVRIADTWKNVTFQKTISISRDESLKYAAPIGLALREFM